MKTLCRKKIAAAAAAMAMVMAATPAFPAFADNPRTTDYTINTEMTGSIKLYKLIESDGANKVGDGLDHSEDVARTKNSKQLALNNVGFTYKKIADIISVAGNNQVGVYFNNVDAGFASLAKALGYDLAAETNKTVIEGNTYYTTTQMESALAYVNAHAGDGHTGVGMGYTGETDLNAYLKSAEKTADAGTVYTDANGSILFDNLALGLYLVGETDISAHDGLDASGNVIQESPNPEAPVIESLASPFLVSVPTTNMVKTGDKEPGTVWIYDVSVYPKDTENSITKRIVDPDEKASRTLRTHEDYQIGDTIEQVIYADAPALQPGVKHEKYVLSDTMTRSLTFDKVTKVTYGPRVLDPQKDTDLPSGKFDEGDYVVEVGADKHSFSVTLSGTGLAKLDTEGAKTVVVWFESTLNKDAYIGANNGNENHPTINWRNTNGVERSYDGNHVYDYTYQLNIKKEGLSANKGSQAVFVFQRHDTKASVEAGGTPAENAALDVKFVKEGDGVYHVFDEKHGDTDPAKAITRISPNAAGSLQVKGLDSNRYTLKEVATEAGKDLLKSTFDIMLTAPDPARDGNLLANNKTTKVYGACVKTPDIGEAVPLTHESGIASVVVKNYKAVTLKTGGDGRVMVYVVGLGMLVTLSAFAVTRKRKKA